MAQCSMCDGTGVVWTEGDGDGRSPWKSRKPIPCPACNGKGHK